MHQIVLAIHLNSSLKCLFGMLNAFRDDKINKFKDSKPHSWSRSYKIYLVVKKLNTSNFPVGVLVNLKFNNKWSGLNAPDRIKRKFLKMSYERGGLNSECPRNFYIR